MTNEILKINDLNKSFAKRKVINKLDLTVSRGDIYGFIGANGQGKTTTIRMITGLVFPDSGEILINGKSVFNEKKTSLKNLGAMVEAPRFYENLSGYENLKLMANLIDNVGEKEIQEVLELVHLSDRQKDKFSNYSMGMKQRLGIANTLLGNPDLIILDEPTNGLDPNGMEEINELIIYLAKTFQKTFFISSHLLHEMEGICNRIGILHQGKLCVEGELKELLFQSNVANLKELYFQKVGYHHA